MNRDMNDLFTVTPTTAKILYALFNNPLSGGIRVSRLTGLGHRGIYIHLHRLCQMDYVRKKGLKYELTTLGQSVMFAFKIFKEQRDEQQRVSTSRKNIQSESHRVTESNLVGGS